METEYNEYHYYEKLEVINKLLDFIDTHYNDNGERTKLARDYLHEISLVADMAETDRRRYEKEIYLLKEKLQKITGIIS